MAEEDRIVPPEDIALLLELRDFVMQGNRAELVKDRSGRLVGYKRILCDSKDYRDKKAA